MGSFDGAETCELVGCYLLSLLTDKYGQSISLYRDDGLAAFNKTPQEIEKIKKELCKLFRENDLKITIEANKTIVNFLDVTLDLQSGKHYPYTKAGNVPLYVHKKSNHPPSILKNIPDSINKRLSEISSDRQCFDNAKTVYQEALNKSGYNYNLSYNEPRSEISTQGRTDQETFYALRSAVVLGRFEAICVFGGVGHSRVEEEMNIVNGQFPNTEIEPASTVQQGHVGTDCSGNSHTKDTCSRLTTAADVNTMSQDTCTSQHYDLDHSVVQRHTHPSGSLETNHSISPEGPSAPGSDLSTVHRDGVHYTGVSGSVQRIVPQEGRTEGGYPFEIFFSEPLPEDVTSGKAYFCHEPVGIAELTKLGPCLFHGIVPESPRPDVVPVTVITQTGLPLGITYFKYIDKEYSVAMEILNGDVNLQKLLNIIAKTPDCSNQTKQQHSVQFLQLLVYTASQTGEKG
ncbi:uncharacterized protein [Montipora capricornis]|uniref:uncharacterized protein n=1 Tax=Montipora capricornis TaxID=246305 RepID=UPI0035F1710B